MAERKVQEQSKITFKSKPKPEWLQKMENSGGATSGRMSATTPDGRRSIQRPSRQR